MVSFFIGAAIASEVLFRGTGVDRPLDFNGFGDKRSCRENQDQN